MDGREGGCGPRPGSPGSPAARSLSSHGLDPSCPFPQPSTSLPCPSGLASWKKQPPFSRLEHWNVQQGGPGHSPRLRACCLCRCPAQVTSSGRGAPAWLWPEGASRRKTGQERRGDRKATTEGNAIPLATPSIPGNADWKVPAARRPMSECSTWGIRILRAGPWASPAQKGFPGKRRQ